jgi:hypothetical protein
MQPKLPASSSHLVSLGAPLGDFRTSSLLACCFPAVSAAFCSAGVAGSLAARSWKLFYCSPSHTIVTSNIWSSKRYV